MNALQLKASAPEIVAHRDAALAKLNEAVELLKETFDHADQVAQNGHSAHGLLVALSKMVNTGRYDIEALRIKLDQSVWQSFFIHDAFWQMMDQQARDDIESSLEKVPPEASLDNLKASIGHYCGQASLLFKRGLVNTFKHLSRSYTFHNGFKIGNRLVLTCIQDESGRFYSSAVEQLRDVDRVFHVLNGAPTPHFGDSLAGRLSTACRDAAQGGEAGSGSVETDYATVRFFKNGNAHLLFKRADLVTTTNHIIAEHYGETLGDRTNNAL